MGFCSFKTKYRLRIHIDTHLETRYECPVCGLSLNTRRTLRMHLLVHDDHKGFHCYCGKAFKRSKDLKVNIVTMCAFGAVFSRRF